MFFCGSLFLSHCCPAFDQDGVIHDMKTNFAASLTPGDMDKVVLEELREGGSQEVFSVIQYVVCIVHI